MKKALCALLSVALLFLVFPWLSVGIQGLGMPADSVPQLGRIVPCDQVMNIQSGAWKNEATKPDLPYEGIANTFLLLRPVVRVVRLARGEAPILPSALALAINHPKLAPPRATGYTHACVYGYI